MFPGLTTRVSGKAGGSRAPGGAFGSILCRPEPVIAMETDPSEIERMIKATLQESLKTMAGPIFQETNKAAEDREAARELRLQQSIEKAFIEQKGKSHSRSKMRSARAMAPLSIRSRPSPCVSKRWS